MRRGVQRALRRAMRCAVRCAMRRAMRRAVRPVARSGVTVRLRRGSKRAAGGGVGVRAGRLGWHACQVLEERGEVLAALLLRVGVGVGVGVS